MDAAEIRLKKPAYSFTCVPNALLRDDRLSLKAKGLYVLMFSKPDDWVFREEALVKESKDGRDALRAGLDELQKCGWLSREQSREGGAFGTTIFRLKTVFFVAGKAVDGKPVAGKTVDGKSAPTNTEYTNTERTKNPPTPKGEWFEEFWLAWPSSDRKVDKAKCLRKWGVDGLDLRHEQVFAALQAWKLCPDWKKDGGKFIPAPIVWLNNRRWEAPPVIRPVAKHGDGKVAF